LSQIYVETISSNGFNSVVTNADTYDNEFRFSHGAISFIPLITVRNLLRLQIDGRPGDLLVGGEQNVFFCRAKDPVVPGFALQAQWLFREHINAFRWLVLGWQLNRRGVWPDWGTYRPAGSKFFW
jgi:hypothetical protein